MNQRSPVHPASHPSAPIAGGWLVAVDGRTLPLQCAALRADACGGLARVVLEQRYRNPHSEPLHVTYLLPLPVDGAVSGFAFRINGRRVVGEVDRRAAARERFEEAILEGRTAALLEQNRASLFSQELGNIPPGAEVVAELTIDQRLRWLDTGAWEWRFPTVVAPRYLGAEGHVPDAPRVTVDVAEAPTPVRITLSLLIRDGVPPGRAPESPSHAIRAGRQDDGLEVGLADAGGAALDQDLVVRWPVATPAVGLAVDTGRPAADLPHGDVAYGLLTLVPPAGSASTRAFPRDLIVLLDTSGSMSGVPLAQARAVVAGMIDALGDADRLEMVAFADRPRRWRARPAVATAAVRAEARRWLDGLEAGGGTEMGQGIAEALRPLRPDAQRQVVLVTDGLIGFEREMVAAVARDLPPGSRLHTVGVGSAVNRDLTAPAARAGRGAEVLVGLDEDAAEAVRRLVARTRAPLLTDVALEGSALVGHAPARLPDLLAGGPAMVGVRLRPEGGDLRVRGRTPAGAWEAAANVPAVDPGKGSAGVVTLYGREAVEDLELRAAAGDATVEAEIERLGLAFQIATRLTSWVAVCEEPAVDPTQPSRRERIRQALPAGLSVEGLGLRAAAGSLATLAERSVAHYAASYPSLTQAMLTPRLALREPWLRRGTAAKPPVDRPVMDRGIDELFAEPADVGTGLTGRLLRRRDRELVIEIVLDRSVDWRPTTAEVIWGDGTRLTATVDARQTTRSGRLAAGLLIRLALRIDAGAPADAPAALVVTGGSTPLTVMLVAP
jgi:Ca-activated chloride channel family protein